MLRTSRTLGAILVLLVGCLTAICLTASGRFRNLCPRSPG